MANLSKKPKIGGKISLEDVFKAMQEEIKTTEHKVKVGFDSWIPAKGLSNLFSRLVREPEGLELTFYIPSRFMGTLVPEATIYPQYGDERYCGLYVQDISKHFKENHCTKFFEGVAKRLGVDAKIEYSKLNPDCQAKVHFYLN